ncbi:RagB/SusD family nutrient uptake outer membrane protein [termite gut metagenome]|uniref:RagB/SusD family nutrient uptake outer membrane protein n=1 Tax=termite gut metagenome TaxID=433724 RepID=A0A5J4RNB1_9ZZZZ
MKYISFILLVSLLITSCEDFLDTKPQGILSEDILDSTDGVDLLVNAAYAALGGPRGQEIGVWSFPTTNWSYGEVRSDNAYKGGGGTGDIMDIHKIETYDVDATLGNMDGKWYHLYCSIQRCNSALRVLNKSTDEEVADRSSRIGEMKMLRAHYYFELSRLYNKIAYFDENVEIDDYTKIPNNQYTRDQILDMIADELQLAADMLPSTQTETGRVNKYIALAYKAKVRLYQAYVQDENTHAVISVNKTLMQEVVNLCDEIIGCGKYDLLTDFQHLDLVAFENGKESIFAVQYSMNDGTASAGRINWSHLLNTPQGPYSGDGFFLPSQNLINAYQTDNNGLPLFDTFNNQDYSVITFDASGTPVNTNIESNVDPRLDFVVGRPNIRWKTYAEKPCENSWVRDQGTYGYNCSKRFCVSPESPDMFNGWPWGASQLNWQIIRYADVLLWKAEALIEIGTDLTTARKLINDIRERAKKSEYVKDFYNETRYAAQYMIELYSSAEWTQDYARQALRFESRLEKAMEGERFFDLVRWGIAEDVMNHYFAGEKSKRVYYANSTFQNGRDEYYPISNNQYNFSEGMYVQNPGYGEFK